MLRQGFARGISRFGAVTKVALLPREAWPGWLGETDTTLDEVKALLQTFEDGGTWTMTEQEPD